MTDKPPIYGYYCPKCGPFDSSYPNLLYCPVVKGKGGEELPRCQTPVRRID